MPIPAGNDPPWLALAEDGGVPIVLVRHGRTAWNRERRFLGRTDVLLDEHGHAQAGAVARRLAGIPVAAVWTSPLRRAADTATPVAAQHGLSTVADPLLVELSQGELEGQPGHVLPERYPDFLARWLEDPGTARVPGGETLAECQARAVEAVQAIAAAAAPGRPVVVVTHQMVISSLVCHVLELPLRQFQLAGHDNAAFSILRAHRGRLSLHRLNDGDHLPVSPR